MFRRNNSISGLQTPENSSAPSTMSELPLRPVAAPQAPAAPSSPSAFSSPSNVQPLAPRQPAAAVAPSASKPAELPVSRFGGIPGVMSRRPSQSSETTASSDQPAMRKLIVGREISLSGDITACDILVVEGHIEATLRDGRHLEITEEGHFKGSVEIDEADIAGKFDGALTVRGRLKIRSTGLIQGSLTYGELEVEAGGRVIGDIKTLSPVSATKAETKVAAGAEG